MNPEEESCLNADKRCWKSMLDKTVENTVMYVTAPVFLDDGVVRHVKTDESRRRIYSSRV